MSNRVPAATTQDASTGDEHIRAAIAHLQAAHRDSTWVSQQWRQGRWARITLTQALDLLFTFAPQQP